MNCQSTTHLFNLSELCALQAASALYCVLTALYKDGWPRVAREIKHTRLAELERDAMPSANQFDKLRTSNAIGHSHQPDSCFHQSISALGFHEMPVVGAYSNTRSRDARKIPGGCHHGENFAVWQTSVCNEPAGAEALALISGRRT
jgi:hypothetical protein